MNKKLIAIAIAAAVSAPAMAATSNVEVYGLVSMGVDSVTNVDSATPTVSGNTTRVGRVSDYSSRIGFKGAEDLGNGLKAVWQIEQAVKMDGGDATAFGGGGLRNTYFGLNSKDMGEVRFGRHDTPYKMATGRLDVFGDTLGDYNGIVGAAANGKGAGGYFDQRVSNVVAYITPNFGGFSAVGAYVFGAELATSGTSSKGNAYSLAGMYDAGPLYLTAAYEKHNLGTGASGTLGGFAADQERKAWKLGASYSIMDFTLNAMYEKTDDNLGTNGANSLGHNTWYASGKYQMGAVALKAAYAKAGDSAAADSGAKQYTLGADYGFSKRTTVYALYTRVDNGANAAYNFDQAPVAGLTTNTAITGFSLGVKHSF